MEPMVLFRQSTVPGLEMSIPNTFEEFVLLVIVTDPVPVEDPMVFPVFVPILTLPPGTLIPVQSGYEELLQEKF
jgi:hypothetical protein